MSLEALKAEPPQEMFFWVQIPIGSMYGKVTYIYHTNSPNVGKYTSPMDPMGYLLNRWVFGCLGLVRHGWNSWNISTLQPKLRRVGSRSAHKGDSNEPDRTAALPFQHVSV